MYNYDKSNPFLPEDFELHLGPLILNPNLDRAGNIYFTNLTEVKSDTIGEPLYVVITRNFDVAHKVMARVKHGSLLQKKEGNTLCFDVTNNYSPSLKFIPTYLAFLGRPTFLYEFAYPSKNGLSRRSSSSSLDSAYSEPIYEMPANYHKKSSAVEIFGFPGEEIHQDPIYDELTTSPTYRSNCDAVPASTLRAGINAVDLICLDYDQTLNRSLKKLSNFFTPSKGLFSQQEHVIDETVVELVIQLLSLEDKILSIVSKNPDPTAISTFMEKILQNAINEDMITLEMARNFRSRILICAKPIIDHTFDGTKCYTPGDQIMSSIDFLMRTRRVSKINSILFGSADQTVVHNFNEHWRKSRSIQSKAVHIKAPYEVTYSTRFSRDVIRAFGDFVNEANYALYKCNVEREVNHEGSVFTQLASEHTYVTFRDGKMVL